MDDSYTRKIFTDVIVSTQCPFAKKGRVHYGTTLIGQIEFTQQTKIWTQEMNSFIELVPVINPDGFVIGVHGEQSPKSLQELAHFVSNTLNELTIHSRGRPLQQNEVCAEGWQFSFCEIRMFLVVMSSVYPQTNSRYSPVPDSTFMFFQPEASFDNFMPHSEYDTRTQRLKLVIRQDFVRAGKEYDVTIVTSSSEVSKYVKPLNLGDSVVEWWKYL
jgi:YqcI/YcgG family